MSEDAAAATTLPATAAETSPDNPWPLQLLSQKLKMHIDRAPSAWVEGQVIELNRRGGNAYLTLRDIDAEISLPASVWTKVLDRQDLRWNAAPAWWPCSRPSSGSRPAG